MFGLALRSLRHRTGGFVAAFLSMLLGATVLMAFASMLDTGGGTGVPSASKETLTTMGAVVGGWGLLLVLFAVTSTLTQSVRQRATEMALLKTTGATPAQITRMILGEVVVIALAAGVLAVPLGLLGGRALLELLISTHQVDASVDYVFGPMALGMGIGITFLASIGAAVITARRTARMRAAEALADAAGGPVRLSTKRIVAGLVFLALGLNLAVVTATVMKGKGPDAMQTAGQTSIWVAIGLALFAPVLVTRVTALVGPPLSRMGGVSGYLAVQNMRRRTGQLATAVMPIILFTAIGTGTLYMQSIENHAVSAAGVLKTTEQKNVETLNFVVIGMIVLFAAIMLINTLVAATTYRRREFAQQRLTGATPRQVVGMVAIEGTVLTATGVLFGTVAALFTILPYNIARTGSLIPDTTPGIYTAMIALAAALTLITTLSTTRRTLRTPAITAVTP